MLPQPTPSDFKFTGNVRKYYIAAEEVEWDYAPTGWDNWLGVPFNLSPRVKASNYLNSTKWEKALYRGYTDSSFTELSAQPSFQGIQGPTIRSEVGDLIEIMFVNKLSQNYASMHSMGLQYTKANEGASYPNNTTPGVNATEVVGSSVGPGECYVYKWFVPDSAAPAPGEPAKMWGYHSYVTMEQDFNAGLIGPQIVYPAGTMNATVSTYREFPLLFMAFDERDSWMSAINNGHASTSGELSSANSSFSSGAINPDYLGGFTGNYSTWHPQLVNLKTSGHGNGPTFYSMNGYIFANNPPFEMCLNDKVIWYIQAQGGASHVFHMHGNGFQFQGFNRASISINDGEMFPLYMNATQPGLWQVICHVANHHFKGMVANYRIYDSDCPLVSPGSADVPNGTASVQASNTATAAPGIYPTASRAKWLK